MKKLFIVLLSLSTVALANSYKIRDYRTAGKETDVNVVLKANPTGADLYTAVAEKLKIKPSEVGNYRLVYSSATGDDVILFDNIPLNTLKIPDAATIRLI